MSICSSSQSRSHKIQRLLAAMPWLLMVSDLVKHVGTTGYYIALSSTTQIEEATQRKDSSPWKRHAITVLFGPPWDKATCVPCEFWPPLAHSFSRMRGMDWFLDFGVGKGRQAAPLRWSICCLKMVDTPFKGFHLGDVPRNPQIIKTSHESQALAEELSAGNAFGIKRRH